MIIIRPLPDRCRVRLIEGVPGGAKTSRLIEDVRKLLDAGVPVRDIVALSFTREAASQINTRLRLSGDDGFIGTTLHAECLTAIRRTIGNLRVADQSRVRAFMQERGIPESSRPLVDEHGIVQRPDEDAHPMFRLDSLAVATGCSIAGANLRFGIGAAGEALGGVEA